jgi:hypothetical protein
MNVVRIDGRVVARSDTVGIEAASTPAERARLLMREARAAAVEQLGILGAAIKVVRDLSLEVLDGDDAYSAGIRDLTARLSEDLLWRGKSLEVLTDRERARLLAHRGNG